jgi:hypothetical protein
MIIYTFIKRMYCFIDVLKAYKVMYYVLTVRIHFEITNITSNTEDFRHESSIKEWEQRLVGSESREC